MKKKLDAHLGIIKINKSCQAIINIKEEVNESYHSDLPLKFEEKQKNIEKYFEEKVFD